MSDFPDRDLAARALAGAGTVVAVDQFLNESTLQAQVVLPVAGFAEVSGTTTNLEGRVTTLSQRVTAPGTSQADWVIAASLALELGRDLGFESVTDVWAEIEATAPAHRGLTDDVLASRAGSEGVVVPFTSSDGDEVDEGAAELPPFVSFSPRPVSDPAPLDGYALRLVVTRKLYDQGVLTQQSPSLAGLAPGTSVRVSAYDFDRLGVEAGARVRVVSSRGEVSAAIQVDDGVPRGCAAVYFNQPDLPAAELLDSSLAVTDVRIERERD
jgi:NADH-quinone oxidoreductase subunit G